MIKYDDEKIQGYIEVPHFLLKNSPQRNLVVFPADGGDHFLKHGIVKDTILFFDTDLEFEEGKVSCFISKNKNATKRFKLADTDMDLENYNHVGRLVATQRNCESG